MSHLVAVYGTLRAGDTNHRLLHNAEHVMDAWVDGYWLGDFGPFPVAVPSGNFDHSVFVEVYEVDDLDPFDALEGYPLFYDRCRVNIPGLDRSPWMYFQRNPGVSDWIPSGDWLLGESIPVSEGHTDAVLDS